MTRLSGKTVIEKAFQSGKSLPADFVLSEVEATVRDKGILVIYEKAYLCPCKSKEADHLNTCKNCRGTGYIFANPTKTKMIITSIQADSKLKEAALREWGFVDLGTVKITASNEDKLSFMDRIVITDATAELAQIVYPKLTDGSDNSNSDSGDDGQLFAYTKYDIKAIEYIALFNGADNKLIRLIEDTDYTFRDNVLLFDPKYNNLVNPCVTIRYVHNPTYHITDVLRESMTSTQFALNQGQKKLILPVHALGKRAHMIKDVENFDGDRLFDNSWKPSECEDEELTKFKRQLRYTSISEIYNNLTNAQKLELELLLSEDSSILGVNGGILEINP